MAGAALLGCVLLSCGVAISCHEGFSFRVNNQAKVFLDTSHCDRRWERELDVADVPENLVQFGSTGTPFRMLVWGDSHARVILPAVHEACLQCGCSGQGAIRDSTPPALGAIAKSFRTRNELAIPFNEAVLELIQDQKVQIVIMVAYWEIYLKDPGFSEKLLHTVRKLADSGVLVYVVQDVPRYPFNVPRCVAQHAQAGLDLKVLRLSYEAYEEKERPFASLKQRLQQCGANILSPHVFLRSSADEGVFHPFDEQGCLYVDDNHLSAYGAKRLIPMFVPVCQRLARSD
jgi:hypothetical protein